MRRVDFWGSQRPDEFACYGHCTRWRGRWKSQNRKNVYLSPYVKGSLNSKVIKGFVSEQRSRKSFSCFEIPMFYVIYIWTLYVHFTHCRIWLWYNSHMTLDGLKYNFEGLWQFCVVKCFPEPVEIVSFPRQGVWTFMWPLAMQGVEKP